jgi:phosphopantothenoylcysteine decarboxylase
VSATFNVINNWAQGINDTLALGILNEALGADVPVYAFPEHARREAPEQDLVHLR